jgi:hypothetical protein
MKKNIIFFLIKCELGIPHLKNTSKDIIKLSFFSLILLVFSFTNKAFGQASLPVNETFSTVTASGAGTMPSGFSQSGLGGYSGALKFDTQGDYLILNINSSPGLLSFDVGINNSFTAGTSFPALATFNIQESQDGITYSTALSISNTICGNKSVTLLCNTRYIKWIYSIKPSGSNVSLKNIILNTPLTVYAVTGTGSYCAGGTGVAVGLANSQSGVNYQLYNGASTVGSVVAGTGSAISFGLQTTATTYTVVGTNTTSSCESNMSGNAVITVTQLTAQITGANTLCAGNSSTLSIVSGSGASNALNFDGVNDYMATNFDCDVNVVPVTTWEAWVYPTSQNGNWQMIMSIEDGGWDRFIAINNLNVYLGYGCNGWNPTSLTLNQWQHIAVVYNEPANQIIFYKNGVAYPYTIPGGCSHSSAVKYALACSTQGSPGQFFAGSLDEVRVWNVARTQAEIVANMSVTIPSNSSGLVLNYQFNEGTGINTANLVGASYTGTLSNGPTWQVPSTAPITSPVVGTFTWSTGANTSSITINPTVTTSYSVAFTTTAGCIGTSPLATVNVNPLPVISISGSSAICVGETATLVANGANTYTWSNASTATSITLSPASNTSYSLTGTAAGCIGSATTNLTVNANPIITVNSGAICAGQNFTINPNGANTYTIQGGNAVVSPAGNTSYTVVGKSTEGCLSQAFATSSLTVNANPIITVNNGVICAGQNFTINPNGANTYTIQGGNAVVSPPSNASFTVSGTSTAGCVSQAFATSNLTVNPNPTITVNNGTICVGQNFTINPNGANTYTIQGGNPVVSPPSNTNYTVFGSSTEGCVSQAFATISLIVNPNPIITVNNGTICAGQNFTINPNGASTYTIQGGNAIVSPSSNTNFTIVGTSTEGCLSQAFATSSLIVNPNPIITVNNGTICAGQNFTINPNGANTYTIQGGNAVVSPPSNTSYTVAGTSASGCISQAFATSNLTVNPNPTVSISGASGICSGQNASLTANGATNYTWSTGSNNASIVTTPNANTTYTLTGSTPEGCSSFTTQLVTVQLSLSVSIAGPTSVCYGQAVNLYGLGGLTYTWNTGATTGTVAPTLTTTTTFSVIGASGTCSNTAITTISVIPNPIITVNNGVICAGQNFTINPNGANTYTIQGGNAVVSPSINTTYSVIGTSTAGCLSQAFATSNLTVNPNPTITVNNGTICAGQNFTINPNGANTYTIQGANAVVSPTSNASYTVIGTNSVTGCVSQAFATSSLIVNPSPIITVNNGTICAGQNFTINPNGANTYTIQGGNAVVSSPSNANYTVIGTNSVTGCVSQVFATSSLIVNPSPIITVNNGTICAGQNFIINPNGANTYTIQGGNAVVSPPTNTTYTVAGTSAAGCVSQALATSNLTVNPNPTVSISGSSGICTGQNASLTANGATNYTWSTGSNSASIVTTPSVNTTYTLTGLTSQGCSSFTTQLVTVQLSLSVSIAGPTSVCYGQAINLSGLGGVTYTWNTGATTGTVAPTLTTTTTFSVIGASGTCSNTAITTISVIPNPIITVNNGAICAGQNFTINPNGANTYTIQGGNAVVSPTINTTYSVVGTSTAGCVSQAFATSNLTVNPNPIITVNNGTICVGQNFTINPNGANTYTIQGGNPVVSPPSNAIFTVAGTSTAGCVSQAVATSSLMVNNNPIITVNNGTICAGQNFTINPNGANTYTIQGGNAVVSPTSIASYTVIGTNSVTGCISQAFATSSLIVNPNPTITVNNGAICPGQNFTINPNGANTYTIQGGSAVVSPPTNTTYTVAGTSAAGCVSQALSTSNLTVNPNPTVSISGASGICTGQNASLTANGATTYTWSTGSTSASIITTPTANTTYTLTGSTPQGCSSFTTQLVTVQLSLSVSIAGPTTVCYGEPANISGLGGVTYTWNTGATSSTIAPTLTTTTTFSIIGASGTCSNTASTTISVTPNPTVTITGTNAICAGGSTSLTVNGATTYTWSSGSTSASVVFSPSATSVYSVVGSYSTGCLNTLIDSVIVYNLPLISISGPSVVCLGDSISLVANGANTYVWNNNATTTTIVITPTTTSTYSAVGTDTNGCVGLSAIDSIFVNPLPILSIISTATAICVGDTVKFTAAGANSYAWNIGDNDSLIVVTPTITTTYSVVGTNGFGCSSTKTDSVKVNALPVLTISGTTGTICLGENITLTANGANTYTWSGGINTNSIAVSPSVSTTYSASGSGTNSCVGRNTLQIIVSECTSINSIASKTAIKVYPNPNNGEFTIELTNINNSNITITNVLGQIIKTQKAELINQINLNAIEKGIYFINVMENNQSVYRGSMIKE